jgi:CRP-like cAMP-binding protein
MTIDALVKPLLGVALLQGLRPLQITEIARRAERIVYRPGQIIIEENQPSDAAVLIVTGTAVRVSGPALSEQAEMVPTGALLSEMGMLIETVHSSTVVARTEVRALRLVRDDLHEQMAADPELADHFVQRIASRLTGMAAELRRIDVALAGAHSPTTMPAALAQSPHAAAFH